MGVYHLMGLGRSPGTVIGSLSYLAHRYQRWNEEDQTFFARSGEVGQRQQSEKVGDVQSLVLFTTHEVLMGWDEGRKRPFTSYDYIDNPPGRITQGPEKSGEPMKKVLRCLLHREWPSISGGRSKGSIYWCEVDRRNIRSTYERIIRVVAALAGAGGQGKEIWINLTGGNNVINFALELAATLSGNVARLYYVQAENQVAEKCVRFTAENGYWVDLPVMPLSLSAVNRAALDLLEQFGPITLPELHTRLLNHPDYSGLVWNVPPAVLLENYLRTMWTQGLILGSEKKTGPYEIGPQWELIRPYERLSQQARDANVTVEQLAAKEPWIEREKIAFSG